MKPRLGRKRVFARKVKGQMDFLPEARRLTQRQFSEKLALRGIVSKRVQRHFRKEGQAKTVNVLKEVEKAYSALEKIQGFNEEALIKALEQPLGVNLESILADKAVFEPMNRSPAEQQAIRSALSVIVGFANRKKHADENRWLHRLSRSEYAEKQQVQRHLKGIGKGR